MFGLTKKSTVEQLRAELTEKEKQVKELENKVSELKESCEFWHERSISLSGKNFDLKKQIAKYKPVQGKGGKFIKKNQPEAAN